MKCESTPGSAYQAPLGATRYRRPGSCSASFCVRLLSPAGVELRSPLCLTTANPASRRHRHRPPRDERVLIGSVQITLKCPAPRTANIRICPIVTKFQRSQTSFERYCDLSASVLPTRDKIRKMYINSYTCMQIKHLLRLLWLLISIDRIYVRKLQYKISFNHTIFDQYPINHMIKHGNTPVFLRSL